MAMQGPNIEAIASKYSSDEKQKFNAIIEADNAGNSALAEQLAGKLNPAENKKFDEYLADLEKIQQYKAQLDSRKVELEANMARIDSNLARTEQKRDAILFKYQDTLGAAVADFKVNGHTPAAVPSTTQNDKKHRGCTIL